MNSGMGMTVGSSDKAHMNNYIGEHGEKALGRNNGPDKEPINMDYMPLGETKAMDEGGKREANNPISGAKKWKRLARKALNVAQSKQVNQKTKRGRKESSFNEVTEIQRAGKRRKVVEGAYNQTNKQTAEAVLQPHQIQ